MSAFSDVVHASTVIPVEIDQSKYSLETFTQMKQKFPIVDDETIARFLIARNGDFEKASSMLEAHLTWKATHWPVLKETILTEGAKGTLYVRGVDKSGHPLIHWDIKHHNNKTRNMDEMLRCAVWFLDIAISSLPPNQSKVSVLVNRIGYKSENADLAFDKQMIKLFADNFPERLNTLIVYPSGIVFYGLWNILRFFVDPRTQEKVKIVLTLPGVQEFVNDEWIPRDMGGNDDYKFNLNDYSDPYSKELIDLAIARGLPLSDVIPEEDPEEVKKFVDTAAKGDEESCETKPDNDEAAK